MLRAEHERLCDGEARTDITSERFEVRRDLLKRTGLAERKIFLPVPPE